MRARLRRHASSTFPVATAACCDISGPRFLTPKSQHATCFVMASTSARPGSPQSPFIPIPIYPGFPLAPHAFDLIWVGSLLTHLDAASWHRFLAFFRNLLTPGGLLIFTTCGRQAHLYLAGRNCLYDLDTRPARDPGDSTRQVSAMPTIPARAITGSRWQPYWVCDLITSLPELRLVSVSEKSWDHHQDVYACVRDVDWKARSTPARHRQPTRGRSAPASWSRVILGGLNRYWNRSA